MGQFKPMVKMQTTEPSIELKLKKGGVVKKSDGGMMGGALMGGNPMVTSGMPARGGEMSSAAPQRPSLAARRRAMMARPGGAAPAGPIGAAGRMMKEGGESKAAHKAEMSKMKGLEKELKSHESKPASKGHKGLKTGGVAKSAKPGEYATGGVVMGNGGGFKKGGAIAKDGIIKDEAGAKHGTKMDTTKVDRNSAPTGSVKLGNGGGYKKGGEAKKAYATGGSVNSGAPVAMPRKKPSAPVSNDRQSGTFKKGGRVKMAEGGDVQDLSKGAYDKSIGPSEEEMDIAKTIRGIPRKVFKTAKNFLTGQGVITDSERKKAREMTDSELTSEYGKKKGGPACAC
jgi:hypothetical protein